MKNGELYKKTFRFTLMRALSGLIGTALIAGLPVLTYFLTGKLDDEPRIFACIGAFVVGIVAVGLLSHFIGYVFRAGQIAMVAEGITTGELPDDPYTEGKARIKQRFGTVAVFFAIEKVINLIVSQISNAVTHVTGTVSRRTKNDAANYVSLAINIFVAAVMAFLCSCCMGWVFVHPDENPWRAACDGAIVYFKNWKTLLKNAGKVILMALVSLIVIGGLLFGLTYAVTDNMTSVNIIAEDLTAFCAEEEMDIAFTAAEWKLVFEGVIAFILWIVVHSTFIDPYIMISVMNRYMKAGLENPPVRTEDGKLKNLSKAYGKALAGAQME